VRFTGRRSIDAKGTIVFPSHSTKGAHYDYNVEEFCNKLRDLPEKFHPITICLREEDISVWQKDVVFRKYGFDVVTSGSASDESFLDRFYSIMKNHKYSASNILATSTVLAMDLGLLFFLIEDIDATLKVKVSAEKEKNVLLQSNIPSEKLHGNTGENLGEIFRMENIDELAQAQKSFLEKETGENFSVTPKELRKIILNYFFRNAIPNYLTTFLRKIFYKQQKITQNRTAVEITSEIKSLKMSSYSVTTIPVTLHNTGKTPLASSLPYPVYLTYHWLDENGKIIYLQGDNTAINRIVSPKAEEDFRILAKGLVQKGNYTLQITLVQEGNGWFEGILSDFKPLNIPVEIDG